MFVEQISVFVENKTGRLADVMALLGREGVDVKALTVDNIDPSEKTIKDGSYKIQRPFVLVTKEGTKLSDTAQKFFDYATSKDADDLIEKAGAIPVIR